MEQLLQTTDIGTLLFIAIGCVLLCVVGLVLLFGLQLLGTTFQTVFGVFELVGSILNGGPVAWCGCLLVLAICGIIASAVYVYTSCAANPASMNFCALFGY